MANNRKSLQITYKIGNVHGSHEANPLKNDLFKSEDNNGNIVSYELTVHKVPAQRNIQQFYLMPN